MKKYRGDMFHDNEEWCKVWRKTDSSFQKWHEEFCAFSPSYSKVQQFCVDRLFLSIVYEVWTKKIQKSYLSWDWTVIQNLNQPWLCGFKNGMKNLVKLSLEQSKSEELYIDGFFLLKAYVSARKFNRNYVSWHWRVMQNLKEN